MTVCCRPRAVLLALLVAAAPAYVLASRQLRAGPALHVMPRARVLLQQVKQTSLARVQLALHFCFFEMKKVCRPDVLTQMGVIVGGPCQGGSYKRRMTTAMKQLHMEQSYQPTCSHLLPG